MLIALLAAATLAPQKLPLPAPGPIFMDYLAASGDQVFAPAGNTGRVFVYDARNKTFRSIDGFATRKGRGDRLMGPSSVSVGGGVAWVGNRGDDSICGFDEHTLARKGCVALPSMPDGTFVVAPTHEVWATTPREKSLQILSVKGEPKLAGKVQVEGSPEGYAVDESRGLVFTNLEDKDKTLVIDAKKRKVVQTFSPGCGEEGPRGLAVDADRGLLFVACTDAIVTLDEKTGAKKGRLETGSGVDNFDYLPKTKRLFVAAGKGEKLTIAEAADDGSLHAVAEGPIAKGCRVVVATPDGTAYAADGANGALWTAKAP